MQGMPCKLLRFAIKLIANSPRCYLGKGRKYLNLCLGTCIRERESETSVFHKIFIPV